MALRTLGTSATNSLSAQIFTRQMAQADIAQLAANIKNDQVNTTPILPGGFDHNGVIYIPNRGVLKLLPGDYVAYDSTGWPIVLSALAIASGPWTHS